MVNQLERKRTMKNAMLIGLLMCFAVVAGALPRQAFQTQWVVANASAPAGDGWFDPTPWTLYLDSEQTNATQMLDVSGNSHNASNMPDVATGPTRAIRSTNSLGRIEHINIYDSLNDYFLLGDHDDFTFVAGQPFTWSAWVIRTETGNRCIFGKVASSSRAEYGFFAVTMNMVARLFNNGGQTSYVTMTVSNAITDSKWVHIAFTSDGYTDRKFYTNGLQATFTTVTNGTFTGMANTPDPLFLGRYVSAAPYLWDGGLDECGMARVELTSNEVYNLYWNTAPETNIASGTGNIRIR